MARYEVLKEEHQEEIIKELDGIAPLGLIKFMFHCWRHQGVNGFKDATGKSIPKIAAINSIKEAAKTWDNWLIKTRYHNIK